MLEFQNLHETIPPRPHPSLLPPSFHSRYALFPTTYQRDIIPYLHAFNDLNNNRPITSPSDGDCVLYSCLCDLKRDADSDLLYFPRFRRALLVLEPHLRQID